MSSLARTLVFCGAAIGLHLAMLFGVQLNSPSVIANVESGPESTEVALVENGPEEIIAEPSLPPVPPAPEPPIPEPPGPEPPPDAIPEPVAEPEPKPETPKPPPARPKPAVRKPISPAKPAAPTGAPVEGSINGTPGAPPGKPGRGDNGRASWRNKVRPVYPMAARTARLWQRAHPKSASTPSARLPACTSCGAAAFPASTNRHCVRCAPRLSIPNASRAFRCPTQSRCPLHFASTSGDSEYLSRVLLEIES